MSPSRGGLRCATMRRPRTSDLSQRSMSVERVEVGKVVRREPMRSVVVRAAAFNRFSAAAAVLDASGVIVETNESWRLFARLNGGSVESTGDGVNYLDVCDRAALAGSDVAGSSPAGCARSSPGIARAWTWSTPVRRRSRMAGTGSRRRRRPAAEGGGDGDLPRGHHGAQADGQHPGAAPRGQRDDRVDQPRRGSCVASTRSWPLSPHAADRVWLMTLAIDVRNTETRRRGQPRRRRAVGQGRPAGQSRSCAPRTGCTASTTTSSS